MQNISKSHPFCKLLKLYSTASNLASTKSKSRRKNSRSTVEEYLNLMYLTTCHIHLRMNDNCWYRSCGKLTTTLIYLFVRVLNQPPRCIHKHIEQNFWPRLTWESDISLEEFQIIDGQYKIRIMKTGEISGCFLKILLRYTWLTIKKRAPNNTAFTLTSKSWGNVIPKVSASVNISRTIPDQYFDILPTTTRLSFDKTCNVKGSID